MGASALPLETMTIESRRYVQFTRWGEPIIPITVGLFAVFFRVPATYAIAGYMGFVIWPTVWLGRRLARRNRLDPAVMGLALGFWGLATVIGLGGHVTLPVAALASIVPVVVGIPYATDRLFGWIVVGTTLAAAIVGGQSMLPQVLSYGSDSDTPRSRCWRRSTCRC